MKLYSSKYDISDCWILCNLVAQKLETSDTTMIYEKAESQGILLPTAKIRQLTNRNATLEKV